MPFYIGENKIVDRYIGDKLVIAVYKGETKYFDAYSEITGSLPIIFKSRAAVALKNYLLHGTSEGAGVQTENLFNKDANDTNNGFINNVYLTSNGNTASSSACIVSEFISVTPSTSYTLYRDTTSGSSLAICEYDSNKNYIMGTQYNNRSSVTISTSQNTAYVRASIYKTNVQRTMLVSGSTAPSTYIPYGYEIPLTDTSGVTENLFDKDSAVDGYWLQSSNGAMVVQSSYCVSDYIPIVAGETYISYDAGRTFCWYDQTKTFIETSPKGTGATAPQTASFLRVNLPIANKSIAMLTNLSTPPDRYIPHRYTSDYPLYIGSTKLGEEEYLDYESGKMYKRTENLFDKDAAKLGYEIRYNVITKNAEWFVSDFIEVNPDTHYRASLVGTGCLEYASKDAAPTRTDITQTTTPGITTLSTTHYLRINAKISNIDRVMFTEGSTAPAQYIPYLQPTDPPVPFPAISTYKGENTLSSTETLGEATIKGRINELPTQQSDN